MLQMSFPRTRVQMLFPPLEEIIALVKTDYEKEFTQIEYEPGLPYYLNRLDQIMFSGERVLDAACGVGQWSIALAQRFTHVDAIDIKSDRLTILEAVAHQMNLSNIRIQQGSIEELPYEDSCFDAIFCYGVLMFTQVEKTLAEFNRVLRPGGRVYVCLNADGWSKFLIKKRGLENKKVIQAGQDTLYSTYWWRAIQQDVISILITDFEYTKSIAEIAIQSVINNSLHFNLINLINRIIIKFIDNFINRVFKSLTQNSVTANQHLLIRSKPGKELRNNIAQYCGENYLQILSKDLMAIISGGLHPPQVGVSRAYQPSELAELVKLAGLSNFEWAIEGGLICNWLHPPVNPKYDGYYEGELSVWECLFIKPKSIDIEIDINHHINLAHQAQNTRVYRELSLPNIISNCSSWTYPPQLLEYNQQLAEAMGGNSYLKQLAETLIKNSNNDTEAARKIIYFVQRAIFRDPVSQPLDLSNELPEPLTILLCARGRCGHIAKVLTALFSSVNMEARIKQLPKHIIVELKLGDRWVIVDADAFKNGIIPVNSEGQMLTMEELQENPYQIDRFPTTGWFIQPNTRFTQGILGSQITGYIDAITFEQRGYVSGYYFPEAWGYPPSLPTITKFQTQGNQFHLEWNPSTVKEDHVVGYRVRVGTSSRGWSYDNPEYGDEILNTTSTDVLWIETDQTKIVGSIPTDATQIFASVTAVSSRISKEANTYFWSSEEVVCALA